MGDGNDLILDNLSLHRKYNNQVTFSINQNWGDNSYNIQSQIDQNVIELGCQYTWVVARLNSNGHINGGSIVSGDLSTGWNPTTNFNNYSFNYNQDYIIILIVYDCTCYKDSVHVETFNFQGGGIFNDKKLKLDKKEINKLLKRKRDITIKK